MSVYQGRYAGRAAIVTGGASGLGKEVARRIVAEGGTVALWDLNADTLAATKAEVGATHVVALDVSDQPGVLAAVAGAFAEQGVSIQTVRQEGRGDAATLVLVTHSAPDEALARTVERLSEMSFVRRAASVMRVEGMSTD